MHNLFNILRTKYNQTFIIVTHNNDLAQLCDRTITLENGIVSQNNNKIVNLLLDEIREPFNIIFFNLTDNPYHSSFI